MRKRALCDKSRRWIRGDISFVRSFVRSFKGEFAFNSKYPTTRLASSLHASVVVARGDARWGERATAVERLINWSSCSCDSYNRSPAPKPLRRHKLRVRAMGDDPAACTYCRRTLRLWPRLTSRYYRQKVDFLWTLLLVAGGNIERYLASGKLFSPKFRVYAALLRSDSRAIFFLTLFVFWARGSAWTAC